MNEVILKTELEEYFQKHNIDTSETIKTSLIKKKK